MPLSQVCRGRNQIQKVKHISRDHQAGKWQNHDLNNLVELKASQLPPPPMWNEHATVLQDSQPFSLLLRGFLYSQPMPLGACICEYRGSIWGLEAGRAWEMLLYCPTAQHPTGRQPCSSLTKTGESCGPKFHFRNTQGGKGN